MHLLLVLLCIYYFPMCSESNEGAEFTSPCAWVKHLPNLLRNRVNSQRYPSIYKDWRPKIVEDIEKSDGKETASGQ